MKFDSFVLIMLNLTILVAVVGLAEIADSKFIAINSRLDFVEDSVLRLQHTPIIMDDQGDN